MTQTTHYSFNQSLYHPQLQCVIYEAHCCFKSNIAVLIMSEDSCCDMTSCIDFFLNINPNIIEIQTYAGTKIDTVYQLKDTKWEAVRFTE